MGPYLADWVNLFDEKCGFVAKINFVIFVGDVAFPQRKLDLRYSVKNGYIKGNEPTECTFSLKGDA